jgi:hypothetical protein
MGNKRKILWGGAEQAAFSEHIANGVVSSGIDVKKEELLPVLEKLVEGFPHRTESETRLFQVLEAYRGMRSDRQVAPSARTINLAQRISSQLPGEKFWLVSSKDDGSIVFESDIATLSVMVKE